MIVTLGSIRGSPGVTSWSLLLAAAWPPELASEQVVVEADPSGGVLGARYGWGVDPGLVSFVAALRRSEGGTVGLAEHARAVTPSVWVLPGSESGERARSVLGASCAEMAVRLSADARLWLFDAGRLEDPNPALALVKASATTVLLSGGRPEDVVALPPRVESLRRRGADQVAVLVTSRCPYGRQELAEFANVSRVWVAPSDDDLREAAGAAFGTSKRARRSLPWRHAVEVAADIAALAAQGASTAPEDPDGHVDRSEVRSVVGGP